MKEPQFQPISFLPTMFEHMKSGVYEDNKQFELMHEALEKPWQLDAPTIKRILKVYGESRRYIELHKNQALLWRKDKDSNLVSSLLDGYEELIKQKEELTEEIIRITKYIRDNTYSI